METIMQKYRDMRTVIGRPVSAETEAAAVNTMVTMDYQGEQIGKAEDGLDKIDLDMDQAEKALHGLEQSPYSLRSLTSWIGGYVKTDTIISKIKSKVGGDPGATGDIPRIEETNGVAIGDEQFESQTVEKDGAVVKLEKMEVAMGQVAEGQNPKLDQMNDKADNIIGRLKNVNERIGKLLK